MKNNFAKISLKVSLILLWILPLAAKTLDTGILGMVTDPGGAAISDVTITINNPATGLSRPACRTRDQHLGSFGFEILQDPRFRIALAPFPVRILQCVQYAAILEPSRNIVGERSVLSMRLGYTVRAGDLIGL